MASPVPAFVVDDIEVASLALGPAMTNSYLVGPRGGGAAIAIDPAWEGERLAAEAQKRGWAVQAIYLTHAHFDHFGGAAALSAAFDPAPPVALHPADLPLWRALGGASIFGVGDFDPGPEPSIELVEGFEIPLEGHLLRVHHTPGHSPGHVILVAESLGLVFCGDLIFSGGVGRTDLPGGDWETLLRSIERHVLTLPDETRLLSGHGPATTVGEERRHNPFLRSLIP